MTSWISRTLRVLASHPPFPRADLEVPTPAVAPISAAAGARVRRARSAEGSRQRVRRQEEACCGGRAGARGIRRRASRVEGRGRRGASAPAGADAAARRARGAAPARSAGRRAMRTNASARREKRRRLEANERLDALIAGLAAGEHDAVQEYVGIVLGNSVYPEISAVEHDYEFDPGTRELDADCADFASRPVADARRHTGTSRPRTRSRPPRCRRRISRALRRHRPSGRPADAARDLRGRPRREDPDDHAPGRDRGQGPRHRTATTHRFRRRCR